jgi:predicted DNA binding CopG/RHH family protein
MAKASTAISLRVPTPMLEALKALAQREGVGYQVRIKLWLDERLRKERDKLARRRPRRATSPRQ